MSEAEEIMRRNVAGEGQAASGGEGQAEAKPTLALRSMPELAASLERAGPRVWDVEGVILHGQYGILGAMWKAGKGWDAIDLNVSMASGTPWLGRYPCPNRGPAVLYPGEEDDHELKRRLAAVAKARDLDWRDLEIHVAQRTPRLSRAEDLDMVRRDLERVGPRLTTLDPLYHAAAGGDSANLFKMGELLAEASDLARAADCSLLGVTHYNRDRTREGSERFTGAGAAEWGRFLIAAELISRRDVDGWNEVTRRLEVIGTSIAGFTVTVTRRIRELDPGNPDSELLYEVDVSETVETPPGLTYPQARVWAVLEGPGHPVTIEQIQDLLKAGGMAKPYKRNTISGYLNELAKAGRADGETGEGPAKRWWRLD